MASSAVAALMLARETQRIEAQGTHEVFLAKQLELSEAGIYTEQCVGWNDEDEKTGSFALVVYMQPCCVL